MSAFRKYINNTPRNTAVRRLAPELMEMITTQVRQLAFIEHLDEWFEAWACFSGCCFLPNHLSREDYESWKAKYMREKPPVGNSDKDPDGTGFDGGWL